VKRQKKKTYSEVRILEKERNDLIFHNNAIQRFTDILYDKIFTKENIVSKHKAITSVNKLLIELYWFIGETIVNLQEKAKWGDGVVEKLSQDLRIKYPEQSGFSTRNLWDCKRFCLTYKDYPKLRPLVAEISWRNSLWTGYS